MDGDTVETVTEWESEPLSGGIDGLRELQSREFTGAVTGGRAWLFMLNGRIVGVFDGSLDSFADADGTAYAAPDPSLPLLYAMRETGGETKARYYTNDTALSAADAKLSSGKFTGYIELSENVLSGDYYAVYYGGRRLACAFVGTGEQKQVLTGDEAFEAADDEVGIYEVVDVDVDVVELPDPDPEPGADDGPADSAAAPGSDGPDGITFGGANGADGADAGGAGDTSGEPSPSADPDDDRPTPTDALGGSDADADPPPSAHDGPDRAGTAETAATANGGATDPSSAEPTGDGDVGEEGDDADRAGAATGRPNGAGTPSADADPSAAGGGADPADGPGAGAAPAERTPPGTDTDAPATASGGPDDGTAPEGETDANGDPFSAEEQWRETKSIPSLDPSETAAPEPATENGATARQRRRRRRREADPERAGSDGATDGSGASGSTGSASTEPASTGTPAAGGDDAERGSGADGTAAAGPREATAPDAAAVREELETVRAERDRAREVAREASEQLEERESEVSRLREENERLTARVDELESELSDLRERLEAARAGDAGSGDGDDAHARTVPADRALAGTNLFVRYESKGGATLEKAHAGGASRSEVNDNLRLEVHTDFDAADAAVDGRPFREFLRDTIEYGFVEWAVTQLLYEIQSTRNESALRDLFDAIPEIDRAELNGTVELDDAEGGADERSFDVVLRDRMGNPLVVADVTEGREATTESMLDGLVGDASAVADADEHLAAGFYVTASFFEPGALEAAADATGGGLLSRGKRKSFVKLSRKQGFHLCLVESREGEFHVNVPEL
ncbi:DUF7527 domain-containing protein [Halobaculum sp. EA56]|uniref:DUF7527 domain-containing protein n=1 Tax=Halobaculum sp. EA56 TaxID=3421648 RepID=UPI003EBCF929